MSNYHSNDLFFPAMAALGIIFAVFVAIPMIQERASKQGQVEMITLHDGTLCQVRNKREITCIENAEQDTRDGFKDSVPAILK